jgi:uncharacterized protein
MTNNIDTVKQIYAAVGRGDVKFILDQLDEDATWGIESVTREVPAYGILHGKANIPKFFAAWAQTGEFRGFNPHDFIAAGDHVFNHLQYDFMVKATGKTVKNFSMQHWTFKNGKVIRWRGYEDTAATRDGYDPV